jgi:DNA-binding CsgD family transcriptional regulator
VLVVPARTEVAWLAVPQPAAILFVTDPDRQRRLQIDEVGRRFVLTPGEVKVLEEVVKGHGVEALAPRLGIASATARTHLRHIFEKTGTRRQAELVGLVMQSGPALRGD